MDNWLYNKVLADQEQVTGSPNGLRNTSMKIMFQTIQDAIEGKIGPAEQAAPVAPASDRPDGLLPCPFCGSPAKHVTGAPEQWVECRGCDASTATGDSRVVAAWNRRIPANEPRVVKGAGATMTEAELRKAASNEPR